MFVLTHFSPNMDPSKVVPLTASYVVKNTATKAIVSKTPIPIIDCSLLESEINKLGLKVNPDGVTLDY